MKNCHTFYSISSYRTCNASSFSNVHFQQNHRIPFLTNQPINELKHCCECTIYSISINRTHNASSFRVFHNALHAHLGQGLSQHNDTSKERQGYIKMLPCTVVTWGYMGTIFSHDNLITQQHQLSRYGDNSSQDGM